MMSAVHKELSNQKELVSNVSSVNVSGGGGGGSNYFDPILRSRQKWWEQSTKRA